jgi:hypothetical protein
LDAEGRTGSDEEEEEEEWSDEVPLNAAQLEAVSGTFE